MQIESLTIKGFRCFDEAGQVVKFDNLTCFVGPNASGKTAAMIALARLFGETMSQRQIIPSDFHLNHGESLKEKPTRNLRIECKLCFPELESDASNHLDTIPETFNQMIVDEPGGTPYCRVCLDATWSDDGTISGDVSQSLNWILTSSEDHEVVKENMRKIISADRSKIRVIYIPATRDPSQQIRATTTTSFGRFLDALEWNGTDESIKAKLSELEIELSSLPGINIMNSELQSSWLKFYDGRIAREVMLHALEEDPSILVKQLVPTFKPGEDGRLIVTDDLSDGLRSLFSLSLSFGLFRIEKLLTSSVTTTGFKSDIVDKYPILTIFSLEEPENHLSPQYLGRIINELYNLSKDEKAQIIVSSHSPSILRRIKPDNVRYFLGGEHSTSTYVNEIPLPNDNTDEAFKYVREAVRGFPELYFAHLVILGEGPSEEIILRKLFEVNGRHLDSNFISIVPLGGRHVNHFWRLLKGIQIPYITLLDLDQEKQGAGWGRIKYVRDQLVSLYHLERDKLAFKERNGNDRRLDEECFNSLDGFKNSSSSSIDDWLDILETFNIYYSSPLDIDFSMLEQFKSVYQQPEPGRLGPHIPDRSSPEYNDVIIKRMHQVLASDILNIPTGLGSTYSSEQKELFAWYKYLFIDGSKPVTHMRAMLMIEENNLHQNAPIFLKKLLTKANSLMNSEDGRN